MSLEELSPPDQRHYLDRLSALPIEARAAVALDLIDTARAFMEAGIRDRHPGTSEREVQARVAALLCGADLAHRLYGIDVRDSP